MITIYSTTTCAYCPLVEKACKAKNVEYQKVELDDKPELRKAIEEKTGHRTVPITTDGETYLVGYNPGQLFPFLDSQPKRPADIMEAIGNE